MNESANIFCVRPKRFNVGNELIHLGLRVVLSEVFDQTHLNLVQVSAIQSAENGAQVGLSASSIYRMNQLASGVVVGGGNLFENGELVVDVDQLPSLSPPLALVGISHGRIYGNDHELTARTDSMPITRIAALHEKASLALVRDDATLLRMRGLGHSNVVMGGCPSLFSVPESALRLKSTGGPAVISVRDPGLMSIPIGARARVRDQVENIVRLLTASGAPEVLLLCHDPRDLEFAASVSGGRAVLPHDVVDFLEILRCASVLISFRLHAFIPALLMGTPAINLSYDERSVSMIRTIGMADWDVNLIRHPDPLALIEKRLLEFDEFAALRTESLRICGELRSVTRACLSKFAEAVHKYESSKL